MLHNAPDYSKRRASEYDHETWDRGVQPLSVLRLRYLDAPYILHIFCRAKGDLGQLVARQATSMPIVVLTCARSIEVMEHLIVTNRWEEVRFRWSEVVIVVVLSRQALSNAFPYPGMSFYLYKLFSSQSNLADRKNVYVVVW